MRPQKITFGEMRSEGGPTGLLVYCTDYRCSHSIAMAADQWPDDVRLSDIEPRFVCKTCGKRVRGSCCTSSVCSALRRIARRERIPESRMTYGGTAIPNDK